MLYAVTAKKLDLTWLINIGFHIMGEVISVLSFHQRDCITNCPSELSE